MARGGGAALKLRLQVDGGLAYFPKLARPVEVDTARLAPADAAALEAKVAAAGIEGQKKTVIGSSPPGAADHRAYTLTVEAGGRSHTVTFVDPIMNPALRALVEAVRATRPPGP